MDRPDVFKSAVAFLSDPNASSLLSLAPSTQLNPYQTQNAPLSQRIQFLEAKGLSPPEIDHALRLVANQSAQPLPIYRPAPHNNQWDWRDYFITAVVSGTVAYGAISLLKKYLFPHLKPPTATAYEQDRDALTAQFDAAEALLKEIQAETASVRAAVDEQREHLDKASRDVQEVVTEMRQGETKTRDEMREIRDEIENIREMLPKMIEKNKETQKQSLAELQQELKSLKALLLSRGPNALTSSPSTPLPAMTGRPSIPSWQLANTPSALASSEAVGGSHLNGKGMQVELSTNTSSALASSMAAGGSPPTHSNGKGKEVELSADESSSDPYISQSRMFSQFRQAVENLAQSQDDALPPAVRSQSPESQRQSSAQLAESALVNLRKSIAAQRTASPAQQTSVPNPRPRSASPGPSSTTKSTSDSGLRKTTLEERLRASIAASETSGGSTTPDRSISPPSHRVPVTQHPLSPTSTPVPGSPTLATGIADPAIETPAGASLQPEESTNVTLVLPPQEPNDAAQPPSETSPADLQVPASLTGRSTDASGSTHIDSTADPCVDVTLTQPEPEAMHTDSPQPHSMQEAPEVVDALTVDVDLPMEENLNTDPEPTMIDKSKDSDVEALQERLKLVEQRFAGKKLQVERRDIDNVISELTPLEGSKDVAALREYLVNANMKAELSEAEVLLTASQSTASQTEEENAKRDSDIEHLRVEVSKANTSAKEEEEKRVKAISLLKTVRQKLVKAEKERDDAWRELNGARDKNLEEKEKDRVERANLEREVDAVNADREKAVFALRAQFDKDIAAAKDRADRDIHTAKKQFDTEMNCIKANLTSENKSFFEQLELRQAELESSQCHAESLQAQNTELQFQLKELRERITLLND
ncbi:hypothetical protein JVT61DRAFT_5639 [Boletus reticuloceps]|uniref:Peroxisomal membrane protein PEX14 n=1 Tax=Boletus reticuloceps TaxID=495285 RepID=A0A8I2YYU5_9AGAM|nr:hypothetical protein JVT61DRAFT_5639 [Boletus reticuloceps]